MSDSIRRLIRAVSEDSEVLRQLTDDPASLAEKFDLSREEVTRLQRSDLLIAMARNPLTEIGGITTSPITITVTTHFDLLLADPVPRKLEELSHERLLEVAQRMAVEPEFALRVRAFLKP